MLKRIGLFGGTFDPVHKGHVAIANSFLNAGNIDELWVLLTPFPPHKQDENHASYDQREEMLKLVFLSLKDVSILTIENDLPKPSYTYRTIEYLRKIHSDYNYFYCMGEDSLENFHLWKFPERILDQVNLLVAHRPDSDHSKVKKHILEKTIFVDHEPLAISSSEIKRRLADGESISELVDPEVETYIRSHSLYHQN